MQKLSSIVVDNFGKGGLNMPNSRSISCPKCSASMIVSLSRGTFICTRCNYEYNPIKITVIPKTKQHLTDLEKDVIDAIKTSEYSEPPEYCTWVWDIVQNCKKATPAQISGVVSSLVKKGIVSTNGESIQLIIEKQED